MNTALIIGSIYLFFAILELAMGRFLNRDKTTPGDVWIEVIMTLSLPVIIQPLIFLSVGFLMQTYAPNTVGMIGDWPWYLILLCFLVGDDMTQYWWHRLSHALPWLYSLHRAHHDVAYMSVRLVYRNSLIYYMFMPGIWVSALLVTLAGVEVYAVYLIVKMTVIIGAHSSVPWDEKLYQNPIGARIMWVVERVISTPSTHRMHHGRHLSDGVTHYKGNYGNLLFFWDVLFGSARITRAYPDAYGIEHLKPVPWYQLVFTPFRRPEPDTNEIAAE
ncbi:sterol desaturase family protein [Kordiimonas aquimaris]|uniref:sterol desaturase family protein n=1 Tax=Kordiimonas aquimaris TaxID=707591 RepID=UPI0021D25032|nr:sterol desaturase family protein [Kordiimonas aquimaris]